MIIDDGSTDHTEQLVRGWQNEEETFSIEYYYKKNEGLHTAYNMAISKIKTPLCVCIDSDDWMPENAIEIILRNWENRGSNQVAGIVGLDCYEDGRVIGDMLPNRETVNLIDLLTAKYYLKNGDRTNVVRSELYKKYAPMKVFPGEKYFNPHYLHLQISKEYDFLVLNENLRFVEYQPDGMTTQIFKQYRNSPNSFAETRRLYLSFNNTPFLFRMKTMIHLTSSSFFSKHLFRNFMESDRKLLFISAIPFGALLSLYIMFRSR